MYAFRMQFERRNLMFFKILSLTAFVCATLSFSSTAFAGKAETVAWSNDYFASIVANPATELTDSNEKNIRLRLFSRFNGEQSPLEGDNFFVTTKDSSLVCTSATSTVRAFKEGFRTDLETNKDLYWSAPSWLTNLSRQSVEACKPLRLEINDFVEYRRMYDANPAKYDRLGYVPERIDVNDLVVTASYEAEQEEKWEEFRTAMREHGTP